MRETLRTLGCASLAGLLPFLLLLRSRAPSPCFVPCVRSVRARGRSMETTHVPNGEDVDGTVARQPKEEQEGRNVVHGKGSWIGEKRERQHARLTWMGKNKREKKWETMEPSKAMLTSHPPPSSRWCPCIRPRWHPTKHRQNHRHRRYRNPLIVPRQSSWWPSAPPKFWCESAPTSPGRRQGDCEGKTPRSRSLPLSQKKAWTCAPPDYAPCCTTTCPRRSSPRSAPCAPCPWRQTSPHPSPSSQCPTRKDRRCSE
mmetsp:Transcript_1980/g.12538  ORF Transcript_1980/g.12538 Transcript_1980/m.12538 type:complete len:256 (-) Transcript_1980:1808-2575(-)